MKVIIAPDSFKESMTSLQAAKAVEKGFKKVFPRARCVAVPMADGGEGTVQSLIDATGGKMVSKKVKGPLGTPVTAKYALLGDKKTAVIEMAAASGLPLVKKNKRNPLITTTYGTGELILDALNRGRKKIIVGIGGSATVDGGSGMAQALGATFKIKKGKKAPKYMAGGSLDIIGSIDISTMDPRIAKTEFVVASDVDNPLTGKKGASRVFGPQKGATPKMVGILEKQLSYWGKLIKKDLKKSVVKYPGAGAAGGLGAGLVAFLDATLKSGIDIVTEAVQLEKKMKGADLVITGEGRIDFQTAFGKTPIGVARVAKKLKVPVVGIGGGVADDADEVFSHGIDALASCIVRDMDVAEAIENGPVFLAAAGERVARLLKVGKKL